MINQPCKIIRQVKVKLLIVSLMLAFIFLDGCTPVKLSNISPTTRIKPIGKLGYPFGTYLTIEGIGHNNTTSPFRQDWQEFTVDVINGNKLTSPVTTIIQGPFLQPTIEKKVRCILRGYELCETLGMPESISAAEGITESQYIEIVSGNWIPKETIRFKWQFRRYFEIVRVYPITMKAEVEASLTEKEKDISVYPAEETNNPSGILGYPLGTCLTIEGELYNDLKGSDWIDISILNGQKLLQPITIGIKYITRNRASKRFYCVVKGYERCGNWGSASAFYFSNDDLAFRPQGGVYIDCHFVATSVVEPKSLKTTWDEMKP